MSIFLIKLSILLLATSIIAIFLIRDWKKNKILIAYFFIALFAQTGFCYDIKIGQDSIRTSFAELLYFLILFFMIISILRKTIKPTHVGIEKEIKILMLISFIGIFSAIRFDIPWINILIEVKSYALYIFYPFLICILLRNDIDVKKCLWAIVICSAIPMVYVLPNLPELTEIENFERDKIGLEWGALNILVGYVLPTIPIGISLGMCTKKMVSKSACFCLVIINFYILLYSRTRSGWISIIVAMLVFTHLIKKRKAFIVSTIMACVTLMILGYYETTKIMIEKRIVDQTIEKPDSSLAKRYERWHSAIEIFKEYPIFGTGWGVYLGLKKDGSLNENAWKALPRWHNSFFEIASQLGALGLLSYYFIWFRIGQISINAVKSTHDYRDLTILSG